MGFSLCYLYLGVAYTFCRLKPELLQPFQSLEGEGNEDILERLMDLLNRAYLADTRLLK